VIDLQDERQSDGYFSRGHGQDKQKHNLTVGLMPTSPGHHKCQPRGVEHHLERHQDEDQITAYEQAGESQREQDPR
jgi:hypothetical protein